MRRLICLALAASCAPALLCPPTALAQDEAQATEGAAAPDPQVFYAIGVALGRTIADFRLSAAELEPLVRGLNDAVVGAELEVQEAEYRDQIRTLRDTRLAVSAREETESSMAFVEEAAAGEGAVRTDTGLVITELAAGSGDSPIATNTVKVHYTGRLRDGSVFDSSVDRGTPAEFALNRVIRCWTEGLQRMKVGGKSRLVCPPAIAYGDRGAPPRIPGGAALTFDVELIEIVK